MSELKIEGLDLGGAEPELDADKINNGVWIHFDSAIMNDDGDYPPLYLKGDTSKPQRALVRSYRCKAIKEAEKEQQKLGFTKIRVAKKRDKDGVIAENSILSDETRFSLFLVALENFGANGGEQRLTPPQAKAFFAATEMDNFVQQIREAAYDDKNYLAGPETEAGNASAPSQTAQKTTAPVGALEA